MQILLFALFILYCILSIGKLMELTWAKYPRKACVKKYEDFIAFLLNLGLAIWIGIFLF